MAQANWTKPVLALVLLPSNLAFQSYLAHQRSLVLKELVGLEWDGRWYRLRTVVAISVNAQVGLF